LHEVAETTKGIHVLKAHAQTCCPKWPRGQTPRLKAAPVLRTETEQSCLHSKE